MSLITWPFKRKTYDGILNPRFVSDIQAANEGILDGIKAITGMNDTDFAIITGLDLVLGVPNTYTPGIFYLNGTFYVMANGFNELLYLIPNPTDTLNTIFQDTVSRNIYTVQYGQTNNVAVAGSSPQFEGDMNRYRIGLKYFQSAIATLQAVAASLGTAATKNVGNTAGTVAAGDDPRLVYTQAQFNTLFAGKMPSKKGALYTHYDTDNTFASNFDGTGLGIVFPFVGLALTNGNNGTPNLSGLGTIVQGVYTNPDTTTTTYISKSVYGQRTYQIQDTDLPVLKTEDIFNNGAGGSISYASSGPTTTPRQVSVNAGSPNNPINMLQPVMAVYVAMQIV